MRKQLPHATPPWIGDDAVYFVTVCALPRELNQLCHPHIAHELWSSMVHRETLNQWRLYACVVMPDHLHVLAASGLDRGLVPIVSAWKRYTARRFSIRWQRDFFEHRLRRDESLIEKAEYMRQNPVRHGFVTRPEDWPYMWGLGGGKLASCEAFWGADPG